ncbi:MAG: hypothetical protein JST16_06970 [Bdellovibrionales bacterium]|nr:hypothetical protein [Bdellovibrionales bacterium]
MIFKSNSSFKLLVVSVLAMGVLPACSKKRSDETFSNCKLPIASPRQDVAIGGFPRNQYRIATTGTVHVTIIMVDFPDAVATKTPAEAYALVSGATATFTEMSYGQLNYTMSPTLQWFRMSKASTQYSFSTSETHLAYLKEAVALADSTVNFSSTDLLVVLANPDSTGIGDRGPTYIGSPGGGVTADGNEMLNAITSGHDLNTWGSIWLNHESTHSMGLPDLYSFAAPGTLPFSGGFSYMGYNSFDSNAPGLTAWERWVLGWLDDSQVLCSNPRVDGAINTLITPIGVTGGQKAVVVPISDTKVVVVESRRANGIDANIGKTGALVYTVDSSVDSGYGPIQVYPRGGADDTLFVQSTRTTGESVAAGGIKVEVVSSTSAGDTVNITSDVLWIDR